MFLFRICINAGVLLAAARAACVPMYDGTCAPEGKGIWEPPHRHRMQERLHHMHHMEMLQVHDHQLRMRRAMADVRHRHPEADAEECAGLNLGVDIDGVVHFKIDVKVVDPTRVFFFAVLDFGETKMRLYAWPQRGEDRSPFSFVVDVDYFSLGKNYYYAADYFEVAEGATYMLEVLKNNTDICIKAHVPDDVLVCRPIPVVAGLADPLASLPKAGVYPITLPRNPSYVVDCGSYKEIRSDRLLHNHHFPGHYPRGSQGFPVFRKFDPEKVPHQAFLVKPDGSFHFKVRAQVDQLESRLGSYVPFLLVNFAHVGLDLYAAPYRGFGMMPGGFEVEFDAWELKEIPIYADYYFQVKKGSTYDIEVTKNRTQLCIDVNVPVPPAVTNSRCADVPLDAAKEPEEGKYTVWFPWHRGTTVLHFENL